MISRTVTIGHLTLPYPVLSLAPMEDVTDLPFRVIVKRLGADLVYTEFTSSEGIIREAPKVLRKIELAPEERPAGIQLFGGAEHAMAEAARVAERFKPNLIDINCGCWVKSFVQRNEGAALLKNLPKFEAIVKATVAATPLPVTVKTRLGWDQKSIIILDVAKMVEQAGAKALTVHCRTRDMAHGGEADWSWLEKIKKVISIPLFGNGDVTSPEACQRMLDSGCDGVMIGRGALMNPFIFREIKHQRQYGTTPPLPTLQERIDTCIAQLKLSVQHRGKIYGVLNFRKYYSGYLHGLPNIAKLRTELVNYTEEAPIIDRLGRFLEERLV